MDNFEFCGTIRQIKETEKFKPISKIEYNSGWINYKTNFSVAAGFSRAMVQASGGCFKDNSKNSVKTFSKSTTDSNGNVVKGEKITIAWNKRNDPKEIEKVAGFRKCVVDTGDRDMRYALMRAQENEDPNTDVTGCETMEEVAAELEKSLKKKKEFIAECDFAEFCAKLVMSDKFNGKKFRVIGDVEVNYSEDKKRFYENYHVRRVELMPDDAEEKLNVKVDFYFGSDCIDDSSYEDNGKVIVNGFTSYYDSSLKKNGFKPFSFVIVADEKKVKLLKKKFECEDEDIKMISLVLDVIDGAERKEIKLEDLDEEVREEIECGMLDFEDVKREMGGNKVGDRISEMRFVKLASTKGAQETTFTASDMHPAAMEEVEEEDTDLFDDDDDI